MDWQLLLVSVVVITALLYLGRRAFHTWRGRSTGCGGCKCPGPSTTANAAETLIPLGQGRLRQR